jgi:diguanylate cyclase (GGDEF)-like protein
LAARPGPDPSQHARASVRTADDFSSRRGPAGAAQLSRELEAARRELDDVRQQLDEVLTRDAVLERQAVLLQRALSKTRKFVYRDELTGLPNRRLLLDHYRHATARAVRQCKQVAVLFLDLDDFKHLNDTLGHAGGDAVLQQVAARLTACVRASDTACRLGGDEFVVLLPELESLLPAAAAAAKIRARLAMPYRVDDRAVAMSVSIGLAVYPGDGRELGELLKLADRAMYRDKARRRALSAAPQPVEHDAAP